MLCSSPVVDFSVSVCQATLCVIRNVVLEALASNQKIRLLEEAGSGAAGQEDSPGPSASQGEAELAYLTHEGLFISDALNEAQQNQQAGVQDQSSVTGSRIQAAGSDSASGPTETSVSREQSFMCVTQLVSDLSLSLVCRSQKTCLHRFCRGWRCSDGLYVLTSNPGLSRKCVLSTGPVRT